MPFHGAGFNIFWNHTFMHQTKTETYATSLQADGMGTVNTMCLKLELSLAFNVKNGLYFHTKHVELECGQSFHEFTFDLI